MQRGKGFTKMEILNGTKMLSLMNLKLYAYVKSQTIFKFHRRKLVKNTKMKLKGMKKNLKKGHSQYVKERKQNSIRHGSRKPKLQQLHTRSLHRTRKKKQHLTNIYGRRP